MCRLDILCLQHINKNESLQNKGDSFVCSKLFWLHKHSAFFTNICLIQCLLHWMKCTIKVSNFYSGHYPSLLTLPKLCFTKNKNFSSLHHDSHRWFMKQRITTTFKTLLRWTPPSHLITPVSRELNCSSTSNLNWISQHCIKKGNSSFPSLTFSTPAFSVLFCAFNSYQSCSHTINNGGNFFRLKPDGL